MHQHLAQGIASGILFFAFIAGFLYLKRRIDGRWLWQDAPEAPPTIAKMPSSGPPPAVPK